MEPQDCQKMFLSALKYSIENINKESLQNFAKNLLRYERIFLMGKGRSGLVIDMFAMRLIHLGLNAFCIGKPTTPKVTSKDLIVLASGTGETESILLAANQAKNIGVHISAFSIYKKSSLSSFADELITLPQDEKIFEELPTSKVLVGTLFEQALLITFDSVAGILIDLMDQSYDDLSQRHANIE